MKNWSQDIYGTESRRKDAVKLTESDRADIYIKPWIEAMRKRQRSTILFSFVVIICTIVISAVVVLYNLRMTRKPSDQWHSAFEATTISGPTPFDTETDTQTRFLMDELVPQKAVTIPDGGDLPLNTQWLKQAAYHVIQGERAEKEDRFNDALSSYEKALLIFPGLKGLQRRIGLIHLRQKDYESAADAFEKVPLEEDLTFGLANNLGVSYLAMEEYDKAEQNFLVATKLNPQYSLAYFNLATLYMRTGDLEKASTYFERYLTLKPEDVSAAQTYAMILIQLKRWDRAIGILDQISRLAPEVAPIHFRLAQALSHTPNHDAALGSLRRGAMLVDPRKALSWMSRPEYDQIRDEPAFQKLLDELGASE